MRTQCDDHPYGASISAQAGVTNARFEVADATSYQGGDYDLIAFFDCLHDMADPTGAARHARQALDPDGYCLLVEPAAGDSVSDNLNPVEEAIVVTVVVNNVVNPAEQPGCCRGGPPVDGLRP
jgi:SAM-dependent methyltransferase